MSTIELFTRARHAKELGIEGTEDLTLDWPAVIARKDEIVKSWSTSKNTTPGKLWVPVLHGHASFTAPHEISVDGPLRESYLRGFLDTPTADDWQTEIGWPIFRADR